MHLVRPYSFQFKQQKAEVSAVFPPEGQHMTQVRWREKITSRTKQFRQEQEALPVHTSVAAGLQKPSQLPAPQYPKYCIVLRGPKNYLSSDKPLGKHLSEEKSNQVC